MTLINCVRLYMQINLTNPNEATRVDRPSRITSGTHDILGVLDVNGLAMEASACDNETPVLALFKASQSFAPSPHIPTK